MRLMCFVSFKLLFMSLVNSWLLLIIICCEMLFKVMLINGVCWILIWIKLVMSFIMLLEVEFFWWLWVCLISCWIFVWIFLNCCFNFLMILVCWFVLLCLFFSLVNFFNFVLSCLWDVLREWCFFVSVEFLWFVFSFNCCWWLWIFLRFVVSCFVFSRRDWRCFFSLVWLLIVFLSWFVLILIFFLSDVILWVSWCECFVCFSLVFWYCFSFWCKFVMEWLSFLMLLCVFW